MRTQLWKTGVVVTALALAGTAAQATENTKKAGKTTAEHEKQQVMAYGAKKPASSFYVLKIASAVQLQRTVSQGAD